MIRIGLVCVGVMLMIIMGCGGSGTADVTAARDAFVKFQAAVKNPQDNFAEAKKFLSSAKLQEMEATPPELHSMAFSMVGVVKIDDMKGKFEGGKVIFSGDAGGITMAKEDGQWKVEMINIDMGTMETQ